MEVLMIEVRRIIEKVQKFSRNEGFRIVILSLMLMVCFVGVISFYFVFLTSVVVLGIIVYLGLGLGATINFLLISLYFYGRSIYKNFSKEEDLVNYQGYNPINLIRRNQKKIKFSLKRNYDRKQEKRRIKNERFKEKKEIYLRGEEISLKLWEEICIVYFPVLPEALTYLLEMILLLGTGIICVVAGTAYLILWLMITFSVGIMIINIIFN